MSYYLCVDGASPAFLKALEKLVNCHVADLRRMTSRSSSMNSQAASWLQLPRTPKCKNTTNPWDLPSVIPGDGSDASDIKLCMPPQPSGREWSSSEWTFPCTDQNRHSLLAIPNFDKSIRESPDSDQDGKTCPHSNEDEKMSLHSNKDNKTSPHSNKDNKTSPHSNKDEKISLHSNKDNKDDRSHSNKDNKTSPHSNRDNKTSPHSNKEHKTSPCPEKDNDIEQLAEPHPECACLDDEIHTKRHSDASQASVDSALSVKARQSLEAAKAKAIHFSALVALCFPSFFGSPHANGTSTIHLEIQEVDPKSCKGRMRAMVNNKFFEGFFSAIILINCATMGLEAEQIVNGPSSVASERFLLVAENMFTAFFTIELMVKYLGYGCLAFHPAWPDGRWNLADIFLVLVTGVFFTWILPICSALFGFDNNSSFVNTLTIFRSIRLLRLVRVLQRMPQFREAWLLLRGLMNSARVLLFTVIVIFAVTYLFAIFGMVTISRVLVEKQEKALAEGNEEKHQELTHIVQAVGGLDRIMYTLVQFLTLDSWSAYVRGIMAELSWSWIYFYAYIAVAVFVLMNLVTAIIVDNALSASTVDKDEALKRREKQQKSELKELEKLFISMDTDGSGTLSWQEFQAAFDDEDMSKKWRLLDFDPEDCQELFRLLDDGDGEIATEEFFAGLVKMKGVAQSKDIFCLQKEIDFVHAALRTGRNSSRASMRASINGSETH